ncbi:MAG: AAA family ATPase [Gammaproteobacteria bacterium]|nr:AAA family ATPase [Gammaproteobacteria bacterium]
MKLRALALNQFKKFTTPMRLDGIADGLNVVVGPNEMGKSTLLDALRAALFEKHTSKAQPITALQNDRNQAAPVVELTFELDNGEYRIAKRFIKKPYARLHYPDGRTLESDAAEDALRNLLDVEEPGRKGAQADTLGMWNVLWVQQGESFGALKLPESARSSLHGALEAEVGAVLGGRRGRALPQAIERQLGDLVTSTGKPRGAYKELLDDIEELNAKLETLRTRRQELSRTLEDLEEAQETLKRLAAGERDRSDQADLDTARQRQRALRELESRIEAAASELELRKRNLERAEQTQAERSRLKEAIASEQQAVEAARARLEEARRQETEARSRLDELRAGVQEAETAVTRADEVVSRERRTLAAVERQARIQQLEARHDKARAAETREREARRSAAAILVTEESLKAIRGAANELEAVTNRLTAAATRIGFDMTGEGLDGIEVDGEPLSADRRSVQAVESTTIAIPGRGRIMVEPAIKDRDELVRTQQEARAALKERLETAGAASVQDAEDQHAQRAKALQDAELARQESALHAPATDECQAGAQALGDHIGSQHQILAREMAELGIETLPAPREAEEAFRAAQEQAEAARRALDTARAELSGPQDSLSRVQAELGTVQGRFEDGQARLDKLRRELAEAETASPDDALRDTVNTAKAALSEQEGIVAGLQGQRSEETLEQIETRIERLEKAIHDRQDKRKNLEIRISGLKSRIEAFEGTGLDEEIERRERDLDQAQERHRRVEREVRVLDLLLSTLQAAEREAKEKYLSPVLNRVRPYLQFLFPGADIRIDEDLHITGVVRDDGHEEAFHHLSMGTQEQIAVLVRLAFAEMLIEQGHPATVVLDDALVFSDDRRIASMFDILTMAARNVQIIILTCREQLFEDLGGRSLSLQAADSETLVSA